MSNAFHPVLRTLRLGQSILLGLLLASCRGPSAEAESAVVDPLGATSTLLVPPVPETAAPPPAGLPERFPRLDIAKKAALLPPPAAAPELPASPPPVIPATGENPPAAPGVETVTVPSPLAPLVPPGDVYRLKPLDQVIATMRFPMQQSTEDVVDENGNITLPLLGDVKAVGFTTSELEAELSRLYVEGGFYRRVIITVLVPTLNYTISGEVYRPGRYEIRGTVTLMQAIAEGGNFTEFANKKKIQIVRGSQFIEKNYFEILQDPRQDVEILPRDSIRVPRGW
jgi:polysaccharide export outer membrane protein